VSKTLNKRLVQKEFTNKGLTNKRKCDIIDKHSSRGTKNLKEESEICEKIT
jgi:hypothetical protein